MTESILAQFNALILALREERQRLGRWYRVPELVDRTGLPRQWWYRRQRTLGARPKVEGGRLGPAVVREGIHQVHTPQAFRRAALEPLLGPEVSEESRLLVEAGLPVEALHDPSPNPKITWPGDLEAWT